MGIVTIDGFDVVIDDEDIERVQSRHWYLNKAQWKKYKLHYFYNDRVIDGVKYTITLHRFIMGCTRGDGKIVDHISGNTLDCSKSNLRICSHKENIRNSKVRVNNTCGFKNVQWHKAAQKWQVRICIDDKAYYMGLYEDKDKAAYVADIGLLYLFGDYARLNNPRELYAGLDLEKEFNSYLPKMASKYVGVSFLNGKWASAMAHNKQRYYLGWYATEEEAARARDRKALELLGDKAKLNFPREA